MYIYSVVVWCNIFRQNWLFPILDILLQAHQALFTASNDILDSLDILHRPDIFDSLDTLVSFKVIGILDTLDSLDLAS